MITIEQILKQVGEFGFLSPCAGKIAALIGNENSTVDDIVNVIKYDQAITVDVLKYANSSMSAPQRTITTVKDAVIRLGGARILMQILGKHVKNSMNVALPAYGYDENELWRHSVAAAVAAENLNNKMQEILTLFNG
jgi:HD-like signal output (HDOD) protein